MGQDPEAIRQSIEETRAEMSDTVDALGYKADVKARAKDNVQDKVGAVTGRVTAAKEKIVGQASSVSDATPSAGDLRQGAADRAQGVKDSLGDGADTAKANARQAASVAQENPLGLAVGAVALGFLGGLLIPTTRIEAEKIGPVADDLKDQAREAGQEAIDHGKAVASDAVAAAKDAASTAAAGAQDAAKDAAQSVKDSGQDHAGDLKSSVGSAA